MGLEMLADLWAGRELARRLAVLWALINPLTTTAVWLFLSTSKLVQVAETGMPYPVFVFTGIYQTLFNAAIKLGILLLVWMVYRLAMPNPP